MLAKDKCQSQDPLKLNGAQFVTCVSMLHASTVGQLKMMKGCQLMYMGPLNSVRLGKKRTTFPYLLAPLQLLLDPVH